MAALQGNMAKIDARKVEAFRFGTEDRKGFATALRDSGAFRVEQIKVKSATENYTEALQKQDVTFRNWRQQAKLRNLVMQEQYRIQRMMVMGWKEDGMGRMDADMIIPREVPERLGQMRARWHELANTQGRFTQVFNEQRMRIGLWSQAVQSASHNVVNWGKNTQWAGRQMMVGLSIPMVAFGAATGALAYQLDKEMTRILKVYDYVGEGTEQIAQQQENLRRRSMETARFMASQFAQDAKDTLAITSALAATGQTGPGLQKSTGIVGRAMFLGDLNQEDAIKTAIALQTVYRKEGETAIEMNERLAESFDFLNSIENATNLSMQDMTIAIPKLAGVVNALGGDVKDIGIMMTAATSGGINAAEAANALKTVLFRSAAPNTLARKSFMAKTGTDIDELITRTNGEAIPTLIELAKVMEGMGNVEKAGFLREFFGIYQGSKAGIIANEMLNLADNTTMVGRAYQVANQEASEWAQTRETEVQALQQSASGRFKMALEALKIAMAEVGQPFLEVAASILGKVTEIIKWFNSWGDTTKKIVLTLLGLGAIFGPLVMLTGVFANFIGTIMAGVAGFVNWISRFKVVNAQQQAAATLAQQSALAFRDQATASKILATQLNDVNKQLLLMTERQVLGGTFSSMTDKAGMQRYYITDPATGRKKQMTKQAGEAWEQTRRLNTSTAEVATNANKAAIGFGRVSGGVTTAAGTMGLLLGGTNQWIVGLSTALMLFGSLNLAGKGLAVQQGLVAAAAAAHEAAMSRAIVTSTKYGSTTAGAVAGLASGSKAFVGSIAMAVGPVGVIAGALAAAAGSAWWLKKRSDDITAKWRELGEVAEGAAEIMGVAFTGVGGGDSDAEKRIETQAKINDKYKDQIALIMKMNTENARAEIRRIGLEFYQGTGDSAGANRLMEMLANGNDELTVKVNFEANSAETLVEDLQTRIDNLTSSSWGQNMWERITGNDDKKVRPWGVEAMGLSDRAREEGQRAGEALGRELNNALAKGDARGARDLLNKIQDQWMHEKGKLDPGSSEMADFTTAYRYYIRAAAEAGNINKETYGDFTNLRQVLKNMPEYAHATKNAAIAAGGGLGELGDEALEAAGAVGELTDAQKKVMDTQKGVMGDVWNNVLDEIADEVQANHEAHIDRLEAAGDEKIDKIEADAKAQEARFEKKSEDLDKSHKQQDKNFSNRWEDRTKAIKNSYDARAEAVKATIKAEEEAEERRKKIFEAEKTRIQRLADMANRNIDFNVALNSGDLDEAARLTNDMRATEQQWALEDAEVVNANSLEEKRKRADAQVASLEKERDAALERIKTEEEFAKEALEARQDREKKALEDEKKRAQEATAVRKKAEEDKTKAAVDAANKAYEAHKKNLDLELAYARSMTPKNVAEMQGYLTQIQQKYGAHGINLNLHSQRWASYVARALNSAAAAAQASMQDEVKWNNIGAQIGDELAQGMLGMTFPQFLEWMRTGTPPPPAPAPGRGAADGTYRGAGIVRPGRGNITQHGGGPAGKGSGRAGRPLSAGLYPDEIPTVLQRGEYVVNKDSTTKAGPILEAINNGSFFHKGGLVGGLGAMFQSMLRNGIATAMAVGAQRKMAEGMMPPGGSLANILGSVGAQGSAGRPGRYGNTELGADQLANANTIANIGRSMGASQRDLIIALMTAMQESSLKNLNYGDRDSLGLFQQRPSQGWGTPSQVTNPAYAARKFFESLFKVRDRNSMSLTAAAQAVQRSAFPNAYAKWEDEARAILGATPVAGGGKPGVGPGFVLGKEAMGMEGIIAGAIGGGFVSEGSYPARQFRKAASNTIAAKAFIGQRFSHTRGGGDFSLQRQDTGSDHAWGKALDIFPGTAFGKYADQAGVARGNAVIQALQANAARFGLKYLIWQKKINKGRGWEDYTRYGPNPGPTLGHYDHLHASFKHGGGLVDMLPGLRSGGKIKYDNTIANLHKNEQVLTAPLSKSLERGISNIDQGGNATYNLSVNFTGPVNSEIDIEKAITKVINAKESRMGRRRTVG